MGSRLNIDGAKIKTFRIQRGWTQEQLAEIAGVSARTIQRTETAGCAAFETLRAVAVAFEVDFDQLLKPETRDTCDPEPLPLPQSEPSVTADPQASQRIPVLLPAHSTRGTWTTRQVAAAVLAAGVLTSAILVYRFDTPLVLRLAPPPMSSVAAPAAGIVIEARNLQTKAIRVPVALRPAVISATRATIRQPASESVAETHGHQNSSKSGDEIFQLAELPSQSKIVSSPEPAFLDLPPRAGTLDDMLTIHKLLGAWHSDSIPPGDLTGSDQGMGAVRQAMGQAAKKTGDCFAKVGASMRRAF